MRLIDADKLIEFIDTFLSKTCKRDGTTIPNRWYGALKRCVEEQPTIKKGEWIPVSERLPDMGKYVLCSVDKNHVYESDLEVVITQFRNEGWWTDGRITAWMPLPEPYKEGE